MRNHEPVRVLQVVGGMNRGGVETWLMHVLRHIDRTRVQIDFLVHTEEQCAYDDEIRALGSRIFPCLGSSRPWAYRTNFRRILQEHGPFDVVHSHVHHYSGFVLHLARQVGVKTLIAHSHSDTRQAEQHVGLARRLYLTGMQQLITHYATLGLAASSKAAGALFGAGWRQNPKWLVHHCGIDLAPFAQPVSSLSVRAELGIPHDAIVVGHVGRFMEVKNHRFFVEVAREAVTLDSKLHFLLVGEGPLRRDIETQVRELGLADRFTFTGVRNDVSRLMMGAMDCFLFPSRFEGLPLVLIEAQAAGLPCIISNAVTPEVDIVKPAVCRLALSQSVSQWVEAVRQGLAHRAQARQFEAWRVVEDSRFNIRLAVTELQKLYGVSPKQC